MKRRIGIALIVLLIIACISAWIFMGPGTAFSAEKKYLYIRTNASTKKAVLDSLDKNDIVSNLSAFSFLANRMDYWENIKPGKYEIKKGSSLLSIVRLLRNGKQSPVNFIVPKLRTKEQFAAFAGTRFEFDSLQMISFLNNPDSLNEFDADTTTALWRILPDTYQFYWNTTPSLVYQRLYKESANFWNEERKQKAKALNITPAETYILASIIEEETTNNEEKDTIASVYLNRLKTSMPLQADPTLKFAVRNFGLKSIRGAILQVESPYNTYRTKGLPPGPICIPSRITIDAVLNPAQTDYLFFVANRRLNGHLFSKDFNEHVAKANIYRANDKLRRERDSLKKIGKVN